MTHSLTLELPDALYRRLKEIANATQQPVEQLARQSIAGNLPPIAADAPAGMREELLTLQGLPVESLQQVAHSQLSAEEQQRFELLLERNSAGELNAAEQAELESLTIEADRLMLRKAYAWALLRWHGMPAPALSEIPVS